MIYHAIPNGSGTNNCFVAGIEEHCINPAMVILPSTMSVWHRYMGDEPEETLKKRLKVARYLIKIKPVKMCVIKDKW